MPKHIKYFLGFAVFIFGLATGAYFGMENKIKVPEKEENIIPVQDVVIRNVQEEVGAVDTIGEGDVMTVL